MIGTRRQLFVCPDCGLELSIVRTREGLCLQYGLADWDDVCWRSRRGTAGLCLLASGLNLLDNDCGAALGRAERRASAIADP